MEINPLGTEYLFYLGPVPISRAVATTWVIMLVLSVTAVVGMWRAKVGGGRVQTALEVVIVTLTDQIDHVIGGGGRRFLPLIGTLFLFLVCANVSAVVPDMQPPTAHIETPAALALIVFLSVHYFGIKSHGLLGYLRRYTRPNPLLLPLNILSEVTRTFSLMIRLFGNMMSHEIIIAIVLMLAGLLLPIPFMLLGVLIGIIQAYIFSVLAAVFIGAAVTIEPGN